MRTAPLLFAGILLLPASGRVNTAAPAVSVRQLPDHQVELSWPAGSGGFGLEQSDQLGPGAAWSSSPQSPALAGDQLIVTLNAGESEQFFRLANRPLSVRTSSPLDGETGVAVTRETIVYFTAPLAGDAMMTTNNFYAGFGGHRILSRIELSSNRTKASLFYLEPLPGSAHINVVFDGAGLTDSSGQPVDPDGDGLPGGQLLFGFDTLNLTPLVNTAVIGTVYASELVPGGDTGANAVNKPLAGVTITVDGMEETLRAVTDASGKFTLSPVPPGRFFVHIDGRTVTNLTAGIRYPDQSYYPYVGKAWEATAGQSNNLAGGTGLIYLPLIKAGTLQPVSVTQDTTISFPPSVVSANPALAGVSITVPANSLFNDNGTRGGAVGIAPVPPDRLPGPLPPNLTIPLVITVQTDGALNFDRPAPVCFPNLQKLEPGQKLALVSFNHKTGEWEIVGPMTASPDGKLICTDPGVGIIQPGWHGCAAGVGAQGGAPNRPPCDADSFTYDRDKNRCKIASGSQAGRFAYCEIIQHSCQLGCTDCLTDERAYNACIQYCNVAVLDCISHPDICPYPPQKNSSANSPLLHLRTLSAFSTGANAAATSASADPLSSGLHYYAIENLNRDVVEQRGVSTGNGPVLSRQAILAPSSHYRLWVLEANSFLVGFTDFETPTSGRIISVPPVFLFPDPSGDADGDGLSDDAEHIIGTDPLKADTDGDGIPDGAEIDQGTNPLDGYVVQTGIVATAKTPGAAIDLWAGSEGIVTAEGSAGVSIFRPYDGTLPVMAAHLAIPAAGSAQRVASSGTLAAVAAGNAGLIVIDFSKPAAAHILQQVILPGTQAVAAGGGIGYVGLASGLIVAIDLTSGDVLDQVTPAPTAIQDLALEGDYLYALTADHLYVISGRGAGFQVVGSVSTPFVTAVNQRLFVGGGIAYTVHGKGYNTVDVSAPAHPVLLAAGNTAQFGWKQIVANGSGLGLAAVGPNSSDDGPHDVSLYDLSNPRTNDLVLTTFPTPGLARAVSLYNGLAFVADNSAGLQVINYLAYDNKGVAPFITLSTSFASNQAEEGAPARVSALVSDDVQVRNVAFYLDGTNVFTDGSFPFEFRFISPKLTSEKTNFVLRALASDTGGNTRWSDELTISLLPDTTPPRVRQTAPFGGGKQVSSVLAYFNEPMDATTIDASSFTLRSAGPDGVLGTADDQPIAGGLITYRPDVQAASLDFNGSLPNGSYRATITAAASDQAGNHLAADYSWEFAVADSVFWVAPSGGAWENPQNWSTGAIPGPGDNVILNVSAPEAVITIATGVTGIKSLISNAPLQVNGGTLIASGGIQLNARLTLNAGAIKDTTLTETASGNLIIAPYVESVVDHVTIIGDVDQTGSNSQLTVRNGLALEGVVRLDHNSILNFQGTQTLTSGTVEFIGDSGFLKFDDGNLTLGSGVVVHGKNGILGGSIFFPGAGTLINQGLISADVATGRLNIHCDTFINQSGGRIQVASQSALSITATRWSNSALIDANGASDLTLVGAWDNASGTISLENTTVNLGGSFALANLGALHSTASTVNLATTLDLAGGTFALDATTGPWTLNGGTIKNGTITESSTGQLLIANNGQNLLDHVTVNGDLDETASNAQLSLANGLVLNGTLRIGRNSIASFLGNQTLATGAVEFVSVAGFIVVNGGSTLTLGPAVVVHGQSGVLGGSEFLPGSGAIINQGLISADVDGGQLNIHANTFRNDPGGRVEAKNGGSVNISTTQWSNAGVIDENGGAALNLGGAWDNRSGTISFENTTVNLGGSFTLSTLGTFKRTASTVNLTTALDLAGQTLTLDATTGSWTLNGGTIKNGTITENGAGQLLIANNGGNTLDHVTVNGDLDETTANAQLNIVNGLVLNGTLRIDHNAIASFNGAQTFATGTIEFVGDSGNLALAGSASLTLGPAVVVHGKSGIIGASLFFGGSGTLSNEGLISADVSGGTVTVHTAVFNNTGVIAATAPGSTLSIRVTPFTNAGTTQQLNGGVVSITP